MGEKNSAARDEETWDSNLEALEFEEVFRPLDLLKFLTAQRLREPLDKEGEQRLHLRRLTCIESVEEFFGRAGTIIAHHRLDSDSPVGKRMDWFR